MQIYVINLDRQPQRMSRMAEILKGLSFERVVAVDGRGMDGPDAHDRLRPRSCENISRYQRANVMSHRLAWTRFLDSGASHACVLDDDVFLSPDFPQFVKDASWIPSGGRLVKIETNRQRVFLSRQTSPCLSRTAAMLLSTHLGAAGYVVNREGAGTLLSATARPDRPLDYLMFDHDAIRLRSPIYQIEPALSIQAKNLEQGMVFAELQSSVQNQIARPRKPLVRKIKAELARPFLQFRSFIWSFASGQRFRGRRRVVPFR